MVTNESSKIEHAIDPVRETLVLFSSCGFFFKHLKNKKKFNRRRFTRSCLNMSIKTR